MLIYVIYVDLVCHFLHRFSFIIHDIKRSIAQGCLFLFFILFLEIIIHFFCCVIIVDSNILMCVNVCIYYAISFHNSFGTQATVYFVSSGLAVYYFRLLVSGTIIQVIRWQMIGELTINPYYYLCDLG